MNYTKNNTAKKRKKVRSKGRMFTHRALLYVAKFLLIVLLGLVIIGGFGAFGMYKGILASSPDIMTIDASPTGYRSSILDSEGNEIDSLVSAGANRKYVTIDQIPKNLQHAFVAIEDERFYQHNGIDVKGIFRAGFNAVTSGFKRMEGASTITQQLLKNNVFTDWINEVSITQKLKRKIQEQYLAVELEKKVDKDWILENYLNSINLSQNCLGVQAAALRYFGKDVSDLSISECAVIASITQSPAANNPIYHPENNNVRKEKCLKNMRKLGYISEEEYKEALNDKVYDRIQEVNTLVASSSTSYFVDELVEQVVADLTEVKGYSETQAYKLVYSGGLQIFSTVDSRIQSICEKEFADPKNYPGEQIYINWYIKYTNKDGESKALTEQTILAYNKKHKSSTYTLDYKSKEDADAAIAEFKKNFIKDNGGELDESTESVLYVPEPQASVTIIDQSTGEVKALVGGRGEKTGRMTLNRASNTYRQPGSTFKVLAAYAPAIDSLGHTLASVQDDAPYKKTDGNPLKNYDGKYRGLTSYREAITQSINVVAVKTLEQVTPQVGYDYLLNFGFTSLCSSDIVQVLCLGGITKGVSNLELCAAYATIANGGTYNKPRFYTKILDQNGNVLIDNTKPSTHQVLKATTAWLLTSAMQDVITKGTGVRCRFNGMSIAGKSGTTTSTRDALFAGFTPYYTCVTWGGYDDNSKLASSSYVKDLWKKVMEQAHKDLPFKQFEKPEGIVEAEICSKSGLLPIEGICDHDPRGSMVRTEYFAAGTVPTEYCDHHIGVTVCKQSKKAASSHCPHTETKVFIIGGSKKTGDSKYLLPEDFESKLCTKHKSPSVNNNDSDEGIDEEETPIDENGNDTDDSESTENE